MRESAPRFGRLHAYLAVGAFALCAGFVFLVTGSVRYAAGVLLGPFAGAVARDWQSCCAENSWSIFPWGVGAVAIALLSQLIPPRRAWLAGVRYVLWTFGTAFWFLFAILSYMHALE